jgi:myo-inositol-1(or 4)-monophosphatase
MVGSRSLLAYRNFARELAAGAGKLLIKKSRRSKNIMLKDRINLVTDADLASERYIISAISRKFPDHSIMAEESEDLNNGAEFKWIIDPLDGTTNFAHNFPFYAVSIGLEYKEEIIAGAVFDPERDELFSAHKGGGAFLNRRRIKVSSEGKLVRSLLATGFPYDIGESSENNLNHFGRFARTARAVRRAGSAALDLCYLACGRFDGFWELKLHPWDTAAGKILVEEAGGKVTDFAGRKYSVYGKYILASNGKIHKQMMQIINT